MRTSTVRHRICVIFSNLAGDLKSSANYKNMGIIYKITSPTNRIYVGKTKRPKIRVWEYRWRSKKRKSIVHDSIKGYGWEAHKFEVIEEVADELLNDREIFWIKELNSFYLDNPMGMNMTRGGEGGGQSWMHDVERRKKQSERFKGSGGTFYGRKHTEETKAEIARQAKERNLKNGTKVPLWGAEKGWDAVRRPVVCYDALGCFLKEYISVTEAAKDLNVTNNVIVDSCIKRTTGALGKYVFRYKENGYPLSIEVGKIKLKTVKRPVLTLTPEYEIICEHPSAAEASEFWGIPKTTINRAAMYNWLVPIRSGHVFIYTDLYNEILVAEAA